MCFFERFLERFFDDFLAERLRDTRFFDDFLAERLRDTRFFEDFLAERLRGALTLFLERFFDDFLTERFFEAFWCATIGRRREYERLRDERLCETFAISYNKLEKD